MLDTGMFCGDAQLAAWNVGRAASSGLASHDRAEYVLDIVRDWVEFRVHMWMVLVAGVSEDDADKVELDGTQLAGYPTEGSDLADQLHAFGVTAPGVEAVVAAHRAGKWLASHEVSWQADRPLLGVDGVRTEPT